MRIKGNIRIDNYMPIRVGNGITLHGIYLSGSDGIKLTAELLHAVVVDFAFWEMHKIDSRYSKYSLIRRRKATRRIIHDADKIHAIIDTSYSCPLLSRGKPYSWNQEVYDFANQKFIEKNLK